MTERRDVLTLGLLGGAALFMPLRAGVAAVECPPAGKSEAAGAALLDRYVTSVNAHDTSSFPELFTEAYIQHSGRSPSGLAAQIDNFRRAFAATPNFRMVVEDRVIAGNKVVARTTYTTADTQAVGGVAPTGKPFTFRTIDIWRVEDGKFAEHWDITDRAEMLRQLRGN